MEKQSDHRADPAMAEQFGHLVTGHRTAGRFPVPMYRLALPSGRHSDTPLESYILTLVVRGECKLETDYGGDRGRWDAGPGLITITPARTACDLVLHGEVEALALDIPIGLIEDLGDLAGVRPLGDLGPCHGGFHDPLIEALCLRLWDEAGGGSPLGPLIIDSALHTLGAALLGRSGRVVASPGRRTRLSGGPLRSVLDYMGSQLDGPIRLSELAAVAHLSEFHFARLFKQATGLAPHQYLIRLRVERAKRLIREGRLPLSQVAAACGFSDQSQFSRHFKRLVGVTPKMFG